MEKIILFGYFTFTLGAFYMFTHNLYTTFLVALNLIAAVRLGYLLKNEALKPREGDI